MTVFVLRARQNFARRSAAGDSDGEGKGGEGLEGKGRAVGASNTQAKAKAKAAEMRKAKATAKAAATAMAEAQEEERKAREAAWEEEREEDMRMLFETGGVVYDALVNESGGYHTRMRGVTLRLETKGAYTLQADPDKVEKFEAEQARKGEYWLGSGTTWKCVKPGDWSMFAPPASHLGKLCGVEPADGGQLLSGKHDHYDTYFSRPIPGDDFYVDAEDGEERGTIPAEEGDLLFTYTGPTTTSVAMFCFVHANEFILSSSIKRASYLVVSKYSTAGALLAFATRVATCGWRAPRGTVNCTEYEKTCVFVFCILEAPSRRIIVCSKGCVTLRTRPVHSAWAGEDGLELVRREVSVAVPRRTRRRHSRSWSWWA